MSYMVKKIPHLTDYYSFWRYKCALVAGKSFEGRIWSKRYLWSHNNLFNTYHVWFTTLQSDCWRHWYGCARFLRSMYGRHRVVVLGNCESLSSSWWSWLRGWIDPLGGWGYAPKSSCCNQSRHQHSGSIFNPHIPFVFICAETTSQWSLWSLIIWAVRRSHSSIFWPAASLHLITYGRCCCWTSATLSAMSS